jgi:hypothetical protein
MFKKLPGRVKIKKIKTALLIFSGITILSFAFFSIAQENSSSSKNIFQDSDGDNLSNEEELSYGTDSYNPDTDGDGYTDFVEINSGYDPLKHSPGDKIVSSEGTENINKVAGTSTKKRGSENDDGKNLTDEVSAKVTDLINQSQTEKRDIQIGDLDNIVNEVSTKEITFEDLPEIDKSTIKIQEQDYKKLSEEAREEKEKEDTMKYLTAVGYIIATNAPQSIQTEDDIQKAYITISENIDNFSNNTSSIPEYFTTLSEKGTSMLEQIKDIEVPESMIDYHIKGMQLANYTISLKSEAEKETSDPVAMFFSLSKAGNLLTLTQSLFSEITTELGSLGIPNVSN